MCNGMARADVLADITRGQKGMNVQKKIMVSQIEDITSKIDQMNELIAKKQELQDWRLQLGIDTIEADLLNLRQRILMLEVS